MFLGGNHDSCKRYCKYGRSKSYYSVKCYSRKYKEVSQETAQKISSILDEVGYIPNMGARLLSQNTSHIIGLVIGFDYLHGENAMQDPFVSTFVGQISSEIENAGYYMMIIRGDDCRKVAEVTSRWNVDGLIVLGWTEKSHKTLKKC